MKNADSALRDIFKETHYRIRMKQVISVIERNIIICCYIGDTRVYHFENGFIKEYTKDHSVPQLLVDLGEIDEDEIRLHPKRH